MIVIGLDPGTDYSALVTFTGTSVASVFIEENARICDWFRNEEERLIRLQGCASVLVIEEFESYGMAVGKEVFRTIRWAGNFEALWHPGRVEFLPRRVVKQHLCHTARATDSNIRQALIDRFGQPGTKKEPGVLRNVKSHAWAALAVAVVWFDLHGHEDPVRQGINAEF